MGLWGHFKGIEQGSPRPPCMVRGMCGGGLDFAPIYEHGIRQVILPLYIVFLS